MPHTLRIATLALGLGVFGFGPALPGYAPVQSTATEPASMLAARGQGSGSRFDDEGPFEDASCSYSAIASSATGATTAVMVAPAVRVGDSLTALVVLKNPDSEPREFKFSIYACVTESNGAEIVAVGKPLIRSTIVPGGTSSREVFSVPTAGLAKWAEWGLTIRLVFGATVTDTSYFDFAMRTVSFSSNSVLVTTNHPEAILLGSVAEVKVEFMNHFGVPLTNTTLHILGDEGLTSGGQISTVVNVGSVPVGGLISVTRSFDARSVGKHLVIAKLTCDEDHSESGSALVQVNAVCVADFDHDGVVTGDDQDAFVEAFEAGDTSADMDGDGFVGGDDFDIFMIAFEAGC